MLPVTPLCRGCCFCWRLVGDSDSDSNTEENEEDGERTGNAARGMAAVVLGAGKALVGGGGDTLAPRTMSA